MDCYKKKAIHLLRTKQRKSLFRNRHKKSLYKKEGTKQMSRYSTSGVILSYNSVFCESNFILKYAFAEKNVCTDFENDEILCLDFYPVKVIYSSNQTYKYNNLIKSIWNLLYVDNLRDNSNNLRLNCDNLSNNSNNLRLNCDNLRNYSDNFLLNVDNLRNNSDNLRLNCDNLSNNSNNLRLNVDNLRNNSNNLRLNCDNSKKSVYNSENNFKIHKYKLNN